MERGEHIRPATTVVVQAPSSSTAQRLPRVVEHHQTSSLARGSRLASYMRLVLYPVTASCVCRQSTGAFSPRFLVGVPRDGTPVVASLRTQSTQTSTSPSGFSALDSTVDLPGLGPAATIPVKEADEELRLTSIIMTSALLTVSDHLFIASIAYSVDSLSTPMRSMIENMPKFGPSGH